MRAEIISVGTELLLGQITNTNAQHLAQRLAALGIDVYFQTSVGDNHQRLAAVFRRAKGGADLVVTSGGLGPTLDDLTKETLAGVLGLEMVEYPEVTADIEEFFRRRGYRMAESNRRQAFLPRGSTPLRNGVGTAPGVWLEHGGTLYVLLPGPPWELVPMFEEQVVPRLVEVLGPRREIIHSRMLKFCGIGESAVEERVMDIIRGQSNPTVAPLTGLGEVYLRLTAKAPDEATAAQMIAGVENEIRRRLGRYLFGVDDVSLEEAVGARLKERGLTLATAESCTGGILSSRLTDIPGSSAYFVAGVVAYANEAKTGLLNVLGETLGSFGAVSAETAAAMAENVRRAAGSDLGLAITGIAGPGGATADKPVGLVHFALAGSGEVRTDRQEFWGRRGEVRARAAQHALVLLWRYLADT